MPILVDHIARRLGITNDEAVDALDDFVGELLEKIRTGESVTVGGLGTFSESGGELRFAAEPRLASVVNHRFAGLYPIPVDVDAESPLGLGPGFAMPDIPIAAEVIEPEDDAPDVEGSRESAAVSHEPANDAAPEEESDTETTYYSPDEEDEDLSGLSDRSLAWADTGEVVESVRQKLYAEDLPSAGDAGQEEEREAGDDQEGGERTAGSETAEAPADDGGEPRKTDHSWNRPKRYHEPEMPNDETDDDYIAETEFARDTDEAHDFGGTLVSPPDVQTDDSVEKADAGDGAPPPKPPSEATPEVAAAGRPPVVVRRSRTPRSYWLVIPILVLAIAVVLWLLRQSERAPEIAESETPVVVQDEAVAEPTKDAESAAAGDEPVTAVETGQAPSSASPAEQPWQPGSIDRGAGGYTIVVSSQATRQEAVDFATGVAAGLDERSLPVDVFQGTADGRSRYRVGVGQFETIDAAVAEIERLGSRLPQGAWVLRIRSYM